MKHPGEAIGEGGESDIFKNLTQCGYFAYRTATPPHNPTKLFFEILVARITTFLIFIVIFYTLIYFINTAIPDIPKDVKNTIKRRQHVVTKALEDEASRRRMSKSGGKADVGSVVSEDTGVGEPECPPSTASAGALACD